MEYDIRKIHKEIAEEENRRRASDMKVLNQIQGLISDDLYNEIVEEIEEDECYYNFKIVDNPKGRFIESDNRWINQTTNGGYLGDEFAGTVHYVLNNGKYFEMSYSM